MEKPSSQSHLPEVEQDDILCLMFDDVTNTDHSGRWENFASNHPILAAELRARITNEAKASAEYDKNSEDIRIRMMNTIVFAVNALEQAGRRIKDSQVKTTTSGDVAGEDQPLST